MRGKLAYRGKDDTTRLVVSVEVDSSRSTVQVPRVLEMPVDDGVMLLRAQLGSSEIRRETIEECQAYLRSVGGTKHGRTAFELAASVLSELLVSG